MYRNIKELLEDKNGANQFICDLFNLIDKTDTYVSVNNFLSESHEINSSYFVNVISFAKKTVIELDSVFYFVISTENYFKIWFNYPNQFNKLIVIVPKIEEVIMGITETKKELFDTYATNLQIITYQEIEAMLLKYTFLQKKYFNSSVKFSPNISVKNLNIKNIKCFANTNIEFNEQSNILIGINGRGKTSVLQLLSLALCNIHKPDTTNEWLNIIRNGKEKGSFEISILIGQKIERFDFVINEFDEIECVKNKDKFLKLKKYMILAYGVSRDLGSIGTNKNTKYEDIASLFGNNSFFNSIKQSKNYSFVKSYFEKIKIIINNIFADADINFILSTFDEENFYFKTPTSPINHIKLESMSSGFKSVFIWIFDMICRAWNYGIDINDTSNYKGIIMIDEIDKHLHTSWQRKILPTLQKTFPNVQFIFTTHSPFVIQSLDNSNVNVLKISNNEVIVEKLKFDGKLYGYDLEKIVELFMTEEKIISDYAISDKLTNLIIDLKKSVEDHDKENVVNYYNQIMSAITKDSDYWHYVNILSSEFVKN